jgi:uncharacterized protein
MNPTEIVGGLLAGGAGGIASGFLGITSGDILVPLLVLILSKDLSVSSSASGSERISERAWPTVSIPASCA